MFRSVVLVPSRDLVGEELGLVTNETKDADGAEKITVFVPGAPNPTAGRLLLMDPGQVKKIDMPVNEALKALVSIGKTSFVSGSED